MISLRQNYIIYMVLAKPKNAASHKCISKRYCTYTNKHSYITHHTYTLYLHIILTHHTCTSYLHIILTHHTYTSARVVNEDTGLSALGLSNGQQTHTPHICALQHIHTCAGRKCGQRLVYHGLGNKTTKCILLICALLLIHTCPGRECGQRLVYHGLSNGQQVP